MYEASRQLGQDGQWLQRHPEAGSSWPGWPKASYSLTESVQGTGTHATSETQTDCEYVHIIPYRVTSPIRKRPPPYDPPMTPGISLQQGPRRVRFFISEVALCRSARCFRDADRL